MSVRRLASEGMAASARPRAGAVSFCHGPQKPVFPKTPLNQPPSFPQGKVKLMDGERVVFTEEANPHKTMLEALADYVKCQGKRLVASTNVQSKAEEYRRDLGQAGIAVNDDECKRPPTAAALWNTILPRRTTG